MIDGRNDYPMPDEDEQAEMSWRHSIVSEEERHSKETHKPITYKGFKARMAEIKAEE